MRVRLLAEASEKLPRSHLRHRFWVNHMRCSFKIMGLKQVRTGHFISFYIILWRFARVFGSFMPAQSLEAAIFNMDHPRRVAALRADLGLGPKNLLLARSKSRQGIT